MCCFCSLRYNISINFDSDTCSLKLCLTHLFLMHPFPSHLTVFWCFQGVEKGILRTNRLIEHVQDRMFYKRPYGLMDVYIYKSWEKISWRWTSDIIINLTSVLNVQINCYVEYKLHDESFLSVPAEVRKGIQWRHCIPNYPSLQLFNILKWCLQKI